MGGGASRRVSARLGTRTPEFGRGRVKDGPGLRPGAPLPEG